MRCEEWYRVYCLLPHQYAPISSKESEEKLLLPLFLTVQIWMASGTCNDDKESRRRHLRSGFIGSLACFRLSSAPRRTALPLG
jgi:hypothetical protein